MRIHATVHRRCDRYASAGQIAAIPWADSGRCAETLRSTRSGTRGAGQGQTSSVLIPMT